MPFPKKLSKTGPSQQSTITQHLSARRNQNPEKRAKISSSSGTNDQHVHKTTLTSEEDKKKLDKLKAFDLTLKFGPCVGLSRMIRWNRANELGLDPPQEIKLLIEDEALKKRVGLLQVERCLWYDILEIRQ